MDGNLIQALPGPHNLDNYEKAYKNFDFASVEKEFSWFETGRINIAYEALDRNVTEKGLADKTALYYTNGPRVEEYTFGQLKKLSDKFANVLKKFGVKKGDRVGMFLPRSPELYISFLGILKIGAIVVPLFEAFMEEALKDRLGDCEAVAVVTSPDLKSRLPLQHLPALKHVFVVDNEKGGNVSATEIDWHQEMQAAPDTEAMVWVDRETPMLVMYASGADGKAKGVIHVHNGMVGHYITGKWVHDLQPDDVYWCTADPGWITGIVYGFLTPWMFGLPIVIKGGRFKAEDWCETLEKYGVTVWYSAPTAFRMIISGGDELLEKYDLSKLRHILSVGEPLTPEVMEWSMAKLGIPIYDTWWMSETGMNMICNYRCLPIKLGSIGKPFPGITAAIVDDDGNELPPNKIGNLALKAGWPSMLRGIWGSEEKYKEYFKFQPWFISGDSAYRDEDGYFFFQGRVDGVINTAGERVGPWEVENKLREHPAVKDAGVAGKPDALRGEIVKAYIVLNEGYEWNPDLSEELRNYVKKGLAAHAAPREFEVVPGIPKTKEGANDRKALKGWALGLK